MAGVVRGGGASTRGSPTRPRAEGRDATAGKHYLRAGNYYYTGERFVPPGEKKLDIYRKALRCSQEGLKRRHPNIEFVEVPYEGKTLPAYFMKAHGVHGNAAARPRWCSSTAWTTARR